jgi:NAD(P)-dependent dehydrogenase (short-subunit alcohol dehydrogenase family)
MVPPPLDSAVITGAASGLGRALSLRLARPGARLLLADINRAGCAETVALATQRGAAAHYMNVDVADAAQVEQLAVAADAALGRIDLVVNNAGVAAAGLVGEAPLEDWRWVVSTNLWGVIHGCHAFVPRLRRQAGGAILNVASAAGLGSPPGVAAYNVTKAGVIALSETLAGELRDANVRVTVLCPSFFRTNLLVTARASAEVLALAEKAFAHASLTADDVAAAALRAVRCGRLYCLPMREVRIAWRLKRLVPGRFATHIGPALGALLRRRAARGMPARHG